MENNKNKNYNNNVEFAKTRSGIKAESFTYHYSPTTKDAENYIQAIINKQINVWNSSKDENGDPLPILPKIDITLGTVRYGHKKPGKPGKIKGNHFTPFMLIMPLEVQPDFSPALDEDEWAGFYQSDYNMNERIGKRANIIPPVLKVLEAFCYNKDDIKYGMMSYQNSKSREFFTKFNIRRNSQEYRDFKALTTPRIVWVSKREARVAVLLDPLRLLSDMVKRVDSNTNIYVKDLKSIQIKDYNYKYFLETRNRKGNKTPNNYYETISTKDINILTRNI